MSLQEEPVKSNGAAVMDSQAERYEEFKSESVSAASKGTDLFIFSHISSLFCPHSVSTQEEQTVPDSTGLKTNSSHISNGEAATLELSSETSEASAAAAGGGTQNTGITLV